jgi:hypothetical protein
MKYIYTTADGRQFEIVQEWLKDEDPWVKYANVQTGQEYTARKEAFLIRTQVQILA